MILNVTVLECLAVSLAMKYAAYPIDMEYLLGHQENMLKLTKSFSEYHIFFLQLSKLLLFHIIFFGN